MFRRILKKHPFTLAGIWALIIFGLCSMPGRFIPTTSWLELVSFDKWVHAGIFFVLASLLFCGAGIHNKNQSLIYVFALAAILYGGLLEIMQAKVFSERSADWQDFIANSFGCLVALAARKPILRFVLK